ncbi:Gp19/Gp15/Gp42 family protein [Pseudonocardia sp. RS010]|uniref:Gp19/Gp15/Gp42 family protein n=1 Tax=Pseudonocardia sp. RS010 TaxID=3385979 RepID=UPI0039A23625
MLSTNTTRRRSQVIPEIEARLGRELDPSESRIIESRVQDIEALIATRVDVSSVDESIVNLVKAEALLRLIRNPEGYVSETDGNYAYERNPATASGRLHITDEEWAWLGVTSGIGVIRPAIRGVATYGHSDNEDGDPDTAVWA